MLSSWKLEFHTFEVRGTLSRFRFDIWIIPTKDDLQTEWPLLIELGAKL